MLGIRCCLIRCSLILLLACGATTAPSLTRDPNPTLRMYQRHVSYLDDCGYVNQPDVIQDLSPLLKAALHIEDACIFNPGLLHLEEREGTMLIAFRVYWSASNETPCVTSKGPGGPWSSEWWSGTSGYALAVLRWPKVGHAQVLSQKLLQTTNMEDARLFRDQRGRIRMMFNRVFPPHETGHVSIQVSEVTVDSRTFNINFTAGQDLIYLHQGRYDKNWVPWEGTSLMTYTNYPSFAPHTVLNWVDYDKPDIQLGASAASPAPFLKKVYEDRGGWIRFSGGTPGIRLDMDRFVAVGHVVGDMSCFHRKLKAGEWAEAADVESAGNTVAVDKKQRQDGSLRAMGGRMSYRSRSSSRRGSRPGSARSMKSAEGDVPDPRSGYGELPPFRKGAGASHGRRLWAEVGGGKALAAGGDEGNPGIGDLAEHACNSSEPSPVSGREWWDHLKQGHGHGIPHHHLFWDYFFFLYSWSALPPYEITHISHAFLPYDAEEHTGVVFPTGLQALRPGNDPQAPPALLLGYGKGDDRIMTLTLSPQAVQEYLQPVAGLDPKKYKLCAVGRDIPFVEVGKY